MKEKILNFGCLLLVMIVAILAMNRSELRCNFLKDCKVAVNAVNAENKDFKKILNAIKEDAEIAELEVIIE